MAIAFREYAYGRGWGKSAGAAKRSALWSVGVRPRRRESVFRTRWQRGRPRLGRTRANGGSWQDAPTVCRTLLALVRRPRAEPALAKGGAGAQRRRAAAARALDPRLRGDDEHMSLREHLTRDAGLKQRLATPGSSPPRRACPREGGAGAQRRRAAAARALDPRLRGDDEHMSLREHLTRDAGLKQRLATPGSSPPRRACPREGGAGAQRRRAAAARALDPRLRGDDEHMSLREHLTRDAGLKDSLEPERSEGRSGRGGFPSQCGP